MKLKDIVIKTRSFRRFDESFKVNISILEDLVGLARLSASGANRQPLKYMLVTSPEDCSRVFPSVLWAAYLKDWDGPGPGERPSAYIIILGDLAITDNFGVDHGIAAQSMMLGATEAGLGGCMIASIKREMLRKELNIPGDYEILLILALGKPAENVIIDKVKDGDIRYWRDDDQNHHVPKRELSELIIRF
ncbi:MAG TPA: nitroreductase family protein [Bacteroidales bacterium]|nr:nitroreductase family protein [Bacteroidales bacterium]HPF03030.1 nitroreductase family protein [Bacteroidales bacterium]HPJ59840.1 nitroreductase family protein [Bacteroidales bacterium]HPR12712.1 nitroreductase family protein [Bacteroidales bacterium]HRW85582.1 nitroreductase family protein [Bacteroidales bacterium]